MKTASRTILLLMGLILSLAVVCSMAQAGTYVLKFNHVLGPKEPYHQGFLNWAKAVEEKTKGGLKIEVFHSAQLGVEEDIIEQIRQGANIGQNTDSARLGNYIPGIAIMNGPYFAETLEEVAKLRNAPTVKAWSDELATKFGLKVVSFNWVQGYRHFFTDSLAWAIQGAYHYLAKPVHIEDLLAIVREELQEIMGISAEPVLAKTFFHDRGIPQYLVGHGKRLESIEGRLAGLPGLHLNSNAYRGIALNDCVRESLVTAERIAKAL